MTHLESCWLLGLLCVQIEVMVGLGFILQFYGISKYTETNMAHSYEKSLLIYKMAANPSKSSMFFGGVANHVKQRILIELNFVEASFPAKYRGLPLSSSRVN